MSQNPNLPNDFHFDKDTHTYTYKGQVVVSVTQSLVQGGMIDTRWFTEEARNRGVAVHEAVFLDIIDDLDRNNLHPIIKPFMDAWFLFKSQILFKPIIKFCEKKQFHPIYFYAGTLDILCLLNGRYAIIDIKTGECPTARYQTAAYANFPKILPYSPERFSLRLYNDGRYKLLKHDDENDFQVFLDNLFKVKENL